MTNLVWETILNSFSYIKDRSRVRFQSAFSQYVKSQASTHLSFNYQNKLFFKKNFY